MNFCTVVDGHNGHKISKNREWEIFVTSKKFFEFFNFDPKYLEKVPLKFFLQLLAKSTKSKPGTGSSFRRHFVGKTNF